MEAVRRTLSFIRWRLIPVRYLGRLVRLRSGKLGALRPSQLDSSHQVAQKGYCPGPAIPQNDLAKIRDIYLPRISTAAENRSRYPFVNLMQDDDIHADNPVWRMVFDSDIITSAQDYFGGACTLDSVQILYTAPTEGPLRESQKWHKDFGDSKSLHFISYINDVTKQDDGPFVFIDKSDTKKIRKSPFIRRIDDAQFSNELGDGTIIEFYGEGGKTLVMDPAVCYHYGSRCKSRDGRLALFVTFNSRLPFVAATDHITRNRQKIYALARTLRPDLREDVLKSLIG
jgi:hypothetical protein